MMTGTSMKTQSLEHAAEQRNNNPCFKEQKLSMKCLEDNGYDYDRCQVYFENFKACKGFWLAIVKDRRKKGIHPALPPLEERDSIKQEYLKQEAQRRRSSGQPGS
ncbi:hypothetical protein MTO96_004444 [Rhipicephalus appendiculatus]|uniref:Coiled-coil-helix-coiled-coil-helix domain-containing protein 7 n=1 Tax=Rhipicephalus appendiculatus TaxID=34631 RepID=A0A131Z0P4_RHIAP